MFVTATGPDARAVPRAAQAMADAFRQNISAGVQRTRQAAIEALQKPFADHRARGDFILEQEQLQLQQSVDRLNSDTSGLLQDLTAASAATAQKPAMTARLALAVVIGLLVGLVLAWLAGGLSPRLRTAEQVRESLGLHTFDAAGGGADPRMQMRHVVNALAFDDLPVPAVLAVTGVGGRDGSASSPRNSPGSGPPRAPTSRWCGPSARASSPAPGWWTCSPPTVTASTGAPRRDAAHQ